MTLDKKKLGVIGAVLLTAVLYWLFSGSPQKSVLMSFAAAVTRQEPDVAMEHIHPGFASFVAGSREEFDVFLRRGLATVDKITMDVVDFEITNETARNATARLKYKLKGRYKGQFAFFAGGLNQHEEVDVLFEKQGGNWLISGFRVDEGHPWYGKWKAIAESYMKR